MPLNSVDKNYTLGRGKLYFGQFKPGTLIARGERYLGNSPELSYSASQETLDHYSSDGGIRVKDASVILQQDYNGQFSLDDINLANLAMFFLGEASTVTRAARNVTAEIIQLIEKGLSYQLGTSPTSPTGERPVSSVVVRRVSPAATLIAGIDYVLDPALGRLTLLATGATLVDGQSLSVDYTVDASTRDQVISKGQTVEGQLRYVANNPAGSNVDYFMPYVKITPNGDFNLKGDDWQVTPYTIEIIKKGELEAIYADGRPYNATITPPAPDVPVTGLSVSPTTSSATVGTDTQLTPTVSPNNATNQAVTWSTSDPTVATVSSAGLVKRLKAGSATITATSAADGTIKATVSITATAATVPVSSVVVAPSTSSAVVGTDTQLTATVSPNNASNQNVNWTTSDATVATVSSTGLVKRLKAGSATITATSAADGTIKGTSSITATAATVPVTGVSVNPSTSSAAVGTDTQMTATVSPNNASNQNVNWSTSDATIATVSSTGLVKRIAAGSATITATSAADSSIKGTSAVTVTAATTVPPADMTIRRGINIAGAEYSETVIPGSDPTNYRFSTAQNAIDWKAQGSNIIRHPIQPARWFDTPGGELNARGKADIATLLSNYNAAGGGQPYIIDFHDYAKRWVNGAMRQLGSAEYTEAHLFSNWAKVGAYVENTAGVREAIWGVDFINEPNGFPDVTSEFNYIARPFKQWMRDPQYRNPNFSLNWYVTTPFAIVKSVGATPGKMTWNASNVTQPYVRHLDGTGNNGGDTLVAGQTYTISFWTQGTVTAGTHRIRFNAGNYNTDGGTLLNSIVIPASATKIRLSVPITMPAGQTKLYYNHDMDGFSGVGELSDWNITEGTTLQDFVPWSSNGTVSTNSRIMNGCIAAIRAAGFTGWCLWESDKQSSGLMDFGDGFGFWPDVPWSDPLNRTMLSLHHYTDYGGAYTSAWTQEERDRILPAIKIVSDWNSAKGAQVFIGEWAPPNDASADSVKRRVDATTAADAYNAANWHHTFWAAGVEPGSFTSITAVAPDSSKGNTTNLPIFKAHAGAGGGTTPTPTPSNAATYNGNSLTYNGQPVTNN